METLYDVLGARHDDDADSLKSAYRKAAMANHPDRHAGDPEAVVQFTRIATAYDILRNAKRRAAYDRVLECQAGSLRSKARRATSHRAYQLAFKAIAPVVVGVIVAIGVSVHGITRDDRGGITAGQPSRLFAVELPKRAYTAAEEAPTHGLERAPQMPVTEGAVAPPVEGKSAWEVAHGRSALDAAGQTTGRSAPSIDLTGPNVPVPPFSTVAAADPDREEVAALLARGRATLSNGDVAGARVFLRRAAERDDPQAALALGETYDPTVLKHLGVVKFNGDAALAQEWYRRAADLGTVGRRRPW